MPKTLGKAAVAFQFVDKIIRKPSWKPWTCTKLRSTGVERFTPKFLKKLENPAFSKISWYPIRIGYQGRPAGLCENAIFPQLFGCLHISASFCGHRFPLPLYKVPLAFEVALQPQTLIALGRLPQTPSTRFANCFYTWADTWRKLR
jgi:hypothetical protein